MQQLFELALSTRHWPIWARYLTTTLIVMTALGLRRAVIDLPGYPFLLFYLAIILVAIFFNRGNGIFATLLSAILAAYFLLDPAGQPWISEPEELIALAIFTGTGLLAAALVEALHVAFHSLAQEARRRLVLLRELSHRIRNDLTALSAVLQAQARSLQDNGGAAAIAAAADRVQVLARVHQRLELRDEHVVFDSAGFLSELCEDLKASLLVESPVRLEVRAESHEIGLERAVPMGLIVNELVTNAYKHAFPTGQAGAVTITFERAGDEFRLEVADNGIGMALEAGAEPVPGLGQRLVRALATQLDGAFEKAPREGNGTSFVLRFPAR